MSLKRLATVVAVVVLALGLVSPIGAAPKMRVAVVSGDRVGDRGFTDSAYNGLVKAAKDFGISYTVFECKGDPSTYFDRTLAAAENFDLVFMCPGYFSVKCSISASAWDLSVNPNLVLGSQPKIILSTTEYEETCIIC
jgi:basic membrane lipoprotein Med (substrate-binding protein (PBP1-ABC) superfamily)